MNSAQNLQKEWFKRIWNTLEIKKAVRGYWMGKLRSTQIWLWTKKKWPVHKMLLASELIIPLKNGYNIWNQREIFNMTRSKIKPIICKLELTLGRFEFRFAQIKRYVSLRGNVNCVGTKHHISNWLIYLKSVENFQ